VGVAALQVEEEEEDPQIANLRKLEALNAFCDVLSSAGFDGSQIKRKAPTRETYVAVTQPHSKDCIEAIKEAKTAGQMFYATSGRHLNSDEFFCAQEGKERDVAVAAIEKQKKERKEYCAKQLEAIKIIRSKGELTSLTEKKFTITEIAVLLKWKKVKVSGPKKKKDLVDAYLAAPRPKIQVIWSRSDEARLQKLKSLTLKDMALGIASTQMANAVGNNLDNLDDEAISKLKGAIKDFEDSKGPNIL
jgi:hypothetical protein